VELVGLAPHTTEAVQTPTTVTASRSSATRLPSLTALRFVAALFVFGFHAQVAHLIPAGAGHTVMEWLFGRGSVGVSFFFILSGFVLAWSARDGDTALRFWRRRLAKIYPNHLVTWLAALGVGLTSAAGVSLAVALPTALLVQSWVPAESVYFGMNSVSWSLSCEAFFYAMFPVLMRLLVRVPGRALWPVTLASLACVWGVALGVQLLPTGYHYWTIWLFPVARIPEFIAGMLLALLVRQGRWPRIGIWPVVLLVGGAYVGSAWLPGDFRIVAATSAPLAFLIAAIAASDVEGRPTVGRWRWAVWLGEVSYAFYLLHQMVLRLAARLAGEPQSVWTGVAVMAVSLAVTVGASALLYRWVEIPGMRLLGTSRARRSQRGDVAQ
jgi:peptidoglycan/LPS O-acetylase OafA/YrhL